MQPIHDYTLIHKSMSSLPSVASPTNPSPAFEATRDNGLLPDTPLEVIPPIEPGLKIPTILGNGALFKFGVGGGDIAKVFDFFSDKVRQSPHDASSRIDLALLHLFARREEEAYRVQAEALEQQQFFRVVGTKGEETPVRRRVLALVAPGDFTNNAQIEFILDGSDIGLDVLYLVPGKPLPAALPEHDVAFCAVNESTENLPILQRLSQLVRRWPRPVINVPEKIACLSRDGVASLLKGTPDICSPPVGRVGFANLRLVASGKVSVESLLPGVALPVLIRPVGSHGGKNLEKIDSPKALATYLKNFESHEGDFYVTAFMDYRGADGLFRKYRVVFFEGAPFLCHMALSEQWMIHYINVGMAEDASKRAEEARAMETFNEDFARRHQRAFATLHERVGLDYFIIDCGELPDGRLLVFEADIAMVIHAMDSPALFPYKQGQMAAVFAAFRAMVDRATLRPPGIQEK